MFVKGADLKQHWYVDIHTLLPALFAKFCQTFIGHYCDVIEWGDMRGFTIKHIEAPTEQVPFKSIPLFDATWDTLTFNTLLPALSAKFHQTFTSHCCNVIERGDMRGFTVKRIEAPTYWAGSI
jgi:hypothetical protein